MRRLKGWSRLRAFLPLHSARIHAGHLPKSALRPPACGILRPTAAARPGGPLRRGRHGPHRLRPRQGAGPRPRTPRPARSGGRSMGRPAGPARDLCEAGQSSFQSGARANSGLLGVGEQARPRSPGGRTVVAGLPSSGGRGHLWPRVLRRRPQLDFARSASASTKALRAPLLSSASAGAVSVRSQAAVARSPSPIQFVVPRRSDRLRGGSMTLQHKEAFTFRVPPN